MKKIISSALSIIFFFSGVYPVSGGVPFADSENAMLAPQARSFSFNGFTNELSLAGIVIGILGNYGISNIEELVQRWQQVSGDIDKNISAGTKFKLGIFNNCIYIIKDKFLIRMPSGKTAEDDLYVSALKQYEGNKSVKLFSDVVKLAGKNLYVQIFSITPEIEEYIGKIGQFLPGEMPANPEDTRSDTDPGVATHGPNSFDTHDWINSKDGRSDFKYKVLAFDVDGTICLRKKSWEDPGHPVRVQFERLLERGIKIAIITNNEIDVIFKRIIQYIPQRHRMNLIIYANAGARKFTFNENGEKLEDRKHFETRSISKEDCEALEEVAVKVVEECRLRMKKDIDLYRARYPNNYNFDDLKADVEVKYRNDPSGRVAQVSIIQIPSRMLDGAQIPGGELDERERVMKEIKERLPPEVLDRLKFQTGGPVVIDVNLKNVDKKNCTEDLIRSLGLTNDDVIYFGDEIFPGGNDAVILEAGIKVIAMNRDQSTVLPGAVKGGPGIPATAHWLDSINNILDWIEGQLLDQAFRLIDELSQEGITTKVNGEMLCEIESPEDLLRHIADYTPLKNAMDIIELLKARLDIRNGKIPSGDFNRDTALFLYNAVFDYEEFLKNLDKPINLAVFRGGRGAGDLTKLVRDLPNVNASCVLSGTDDGKSWYYAARDLNATGVPDCGKALLDFAKDENLSNLLGMRMTGEDADLGEGFKKLIMGLEREEPVFVDSEKLHWIILYIQKFLDKFKRDYSWSKFTLRNIPLRSIVLVGAAWYYGGNWQRAIDEIAKLLDIKPENKVVFNTVERIHLVGLTKDGVVYFAETGLTECPRKEDVVGLWLFEKKPDIERIGMLLNESGIDIDAIEVPEGIPDEFKDSIRETTRQIRQKEKIIEAARIISTLSLNGEGVVNPSAIQVIRDADIITYGPSTMESNLGSGLLLKEIQDAIRGNEWAVKILFSNCTVENEPADITARDMLGKLYRYMTGQQRYETEGLTWGSSRIDYVLGKGLQYAPLDSVKVYIPFNSGDIERDSGGSVSAVVLNLERENPVRKEKNDYRGYDEEYGFYSPQVMLENMLALWAFRKKGFNITKGRIEKKDMSLYYGRVSRMQHRPLPGELTKDLGRSFKMIDLGKISLRDLLGKDILIDSNYKVFESENIFIEFIKKTKTLKIEISGDDKERVSRGVDKFLILIDFTEDCRVKDIQFVSNEFSLSRTSLTMFFAKSGLDRQFPLLCDLIRKQLVLPGPDKEIEVQERISDSDIDISGYEDKAVKGLFSQELVLNIISLMYAKSQEIRRKALKLLKYLKDKNYITEDEYLKYEGMFFVRDIKEDLRHIERVLRNEYRFVQNTFSNLFGREITNQEIANSNVDIEYIGRGSNKQVYKITWITNDAEVYEFVISAIRDAQLGQGDFRETALDGSLDCWKKLSELGAPYVPKLGADTWARDYRPKDVVVVKPTITGIEDNIQIVSREFIDGISLDQVLQDESISVEERDKAGIAGLKAFIGVWKVTKNQNGEGIFMTTPKPNDVIVFKNPEGEWSARIIDLDALEDGITADKIMKIFGSYVWCTMELVRQILEEPDSPAEGDIDAVAELRRLYEDVKAIAELLFLNMDDYFRKEGICPLKEKIDFLLKQQMKAGFIRKLEDAKVEFYEFSHSSGGKDFPIRVQFNPERLNRFRELQDVFAEHVTRENILFGAGEKAEELLKRIKTEIKNPEKIRDAAQAVEELKAASIKMRQILSEKEAAKKDGNHCKLCQSWQVLAEKWFSFKDYIVYPNPFPYVDGLVTIAHKDHVSQQLTDLDDMLYFAAEADYKVVFNAQGAGPSVPEHRHYRGFPSSKVLPVETIEKERLGEKDGVVIYRLDKDYPVKMLVVESDNVKKICGRVKSIANYLDHAGFGYNLLIKKVNDVYQIYISPRVVEQPLDYVGKFATMEMFGEIITFFTRRDILSRMKEDEFEQEVVSALHKANISDYCFNAMLEKYELRQEDILSSVQVINTREDVEKLELGNTGVIRIASNEELLWKITTKFYEVLPKPISKAFWEVFKNAMDHGNKLNPNKKVTVEWYIDDTLAKFSITDEGKDSFNSNHYLNLSAQEVEWRRDDARRIAEEGEYRLNGAGLGIYYSGKSSNEIYFEDVRDDKGNKIGTKVTVMQYLKGSDVPAVEVKDLRGYPNISKGGNTGDENSSLLLHLKNPKIRGYITDLMTFCYGQFGISRQEVERMVEIMAGCKTFKEARQALYEAGFNWAQEGNRYHDIYRNYKENTASALRYEILKKYIRKDSFGKNAVIIDIGCGNNSLARQVIANMRDEGIEEDYIPKIIGIDFPEPPDTKDQDVKIEYIQQDAKTPGNIPIEGKELADKILLVFAMHHMPKEIIDSVLRGAKRLLKPDGELIILEDVAMQTKEPISNESGFAVERIRELSDEERKIVFTIFDWHANHVVGNNTYVPITGNYFTESEWLKIFSEAGFDISDSEYIGVYKGRFHNVPDSVFVLKKVLKDTGRELVTPGPIAKKVTREVEYAKLWQADVSDGKLGEGVDKGKGKGDEKYNLINIPRLEKILEELKAEYGPGILAATDAIRIVDNIDANKGYNKVPYAQMVREPDGRRILLLDVDAFKIEDDEILKWLVLDHDLKESIIMITTHSDDAVRELTANYISLKLALEKGIKFDKADLEKLGADLQFFDALEVLQAFKKAGEQVADEKIIAVAIQHMREMPYYRELFKKFYFADDWENEIKEVQKAKTRYEAAIRVFNEIMEARIGTSETRRQEMQKGLKRAVKEAGINIKVIDTFTGKMRVLGLTGLPKRMQEMIGIMAKQVYSLQLFTGELIKTNDRKYILVDKNRLDELKGIVGNEKYEQLVSKLNDNNYEICTEVPENANLTNIIRLVDPADLENMPQLDKMLYLPMPYTRSSFYMAANIIGSKGELGSIDNLTKNIIKGLYTQILGKEVTNNDLKDLLTAPWKFLPKIRMVLDGINNLRKAAMQIEAAA